jgi:chromate transporter
VPDEDGEGDATGRVPERLAVGEVALLFLRLGTVAFGGPAAHIALMHDEVVRRRRWVTEQRFLDLVGATNLIPGPNSTELAIHLGYDRARWRGLIAAGVCFILPAALIVTALAWGYVTYGQTPAVEGALYGIKPVVLAIIARALLGLFRTALPNGWLGVLAAAALAAYLLGVNEVGILAAGAALALAARLAGRGRLAPPGLLALPTLTSLPRFSDPTAGQLTELFLTLLKIGSVLYGSGYVLLAFLRGDFVVRLGWITQQQLLDAVSVGQVTPGPVFTTATFVGYLVAGLPGALAATVGIFLPSFVFRRPAHPAHRLAALLPRDRRAAQRGQRHRARPDGRGVPTTRPRRARRPVHRRTGRRRRPGAVAHPAQLCVDHRRGSGARSSRTPRPLTTPPARCPVATARFWSRTCATR